MRNENRFTMNRDRTSARKGERPPNIREAFTTDLPRPHKPGVRLTDQQMSDFRIALAVNGEKAQQVLERAVIDYINASKTH